VPDKADGLGGAMTPGVAPVAGRWRDVSGARDICGHALLVVSKTTAPTAVHLDMCNVPRRNFILSRSAKTTKDLQKGLATDPLIIRACRRLTALCGIASMCRARSAGSDADWRIGFVLIALLIVEGCTPVNIDIDVGAQVSDGSGHRKVATISEAIDFVQRDTAARKEAVTYRINLGREPLVLDEPLAVAGLKQPHGSRVIIIGAPSGTQISGGFRADKYLKQISSNEGLFKYTLALSDLPSRQELALFQKLAAASPKEIMIRANGSTALWPTRWPERGFVKGLSTSINSKIDLAAISLAALPPDTKNVAAGLWIGGYLTDSYLFVNAPVKTVDPQGIWIARALLRADGKPPERIYLYNLQSFTQCNSFFYDPLTRTFSFCSKQPIEKLEVATVETLVDVSDSENLTFVNIVFELSTGTAVTVRGSIGINFTNVVVQSAGGDGIAYSTTRNSLVSHATVREVGGRAVWLSGGDRTTLVSGGLVLEDSQLQDFSLVNRTYAPAVQADGVGVTVRRNVIFNGPQFAVIYSGNDHIFEDNIMAQLLMEAGDSGFIYTGRDFTSQGNIIRRNILIGTGGQYLNDARGIYLDEFSSGNLVAENVIVGIPYGILMNGGKDNKLLSNLFVLSAPSIWASALGYAPWWQIWRNDHMQIPNGLTVKKLYSLPIHEKPWTTRYPELQTYTNSDLLKPERNRIEENTFLGGGSITAIDEKLQTAELKNNDAVLYQGSLQLLERLRNWIRLSDLEQTLSLVAAELDRHAIRHIPLRRADPVGATFSKDQLPKYSKVK